MGEGEVRPQITFYFGLEQKLVREKTENANSPLTLHRDDGDVQFYNTPTIPQYSFCVLYDPKNEPEGQKMLVEKQLGFSARCAMLFDDFPLHKNYIDPLFDIIDFYKTQNVPTYIFAQDLNIDNLAMHIFSQRMQERRKQEQANALSDGSRDSLAQEEKSFTIPRYFVLGFNGEIELSNPKMAQMFPQLTK